MSHTLYRFFDTAGNLLYVGITADPGTRWPVHAADKPWWTEVAKVALEHHSTKASAEVAEVAAIKTECPLYNVSHSTTRPSRSRRHTLGAAEAVSADLHVKIALGELPCGSQLPSTSALAKQYNVSGTCVQAALATLKKERLIEGAKGRGVFVLPSPLRTITPSAAKLPDETYTPLSAEIAAPPPYLAESLGLSRGERCRCTHGTYSSEGETTALTWSYSVMDLDNIGSLDPYSAMAHFSRAATTFRGFTTVRPPVTDEVIRLQIPNGNPVFCLTDVSSTGDGEPVGAVLTVRSSHRHELLQAAPVH